MGLRWTDRKLAGNTRVGRDYDIRAGQHEDGYPAVTVELRGPNESRTWKDPEEIRRLAFDLLDAACWLEEETREDNGQSCSAP